MTALPNLVATVHVNAPTDHVWRVLTEPQYVSQWLGCMRYENLLGHVFYMQQDQAKRQADDVAGATHCKILALDAGKRFAFSWFVPGFPKTEVAISLAAADGGTDVKLEHSGWDRFEPEAIRAIYEMLAGGWKSFVLPNLKRVAEAS